MRTTITLPAEMMRKIREISHKKHMTLTRSLQEIIVRGLQAEERPAREPSPFRRSPAIAGGARIDYTDKETLAGLFDKYR